MKYQRRRMKMNNITQYKIPMRNQYVAPEGYSFYYNGINQGRIIWTSSPEGYYIDKDNTIQ
jgi:hypothetical protein